MTILSSYTATTSHAPGIIYARWADPTTWTEWDPEIRSVSFEMPATLGKRGRLEPRSGPRMSFSITDLQQDRVFTNTSSLPGARLDFEHVVAGRDHGCDVTVRVLVRGPLAPVWARLLKSSMSDAARSSVVGLLTMLSAK